MNSWHVEIICSHENNFSCFFEWFTLNYIGHFKIPQNSGTTTKMRNKNSGFTTKPQLHLWMVAEYFPA